MRLPVLQLLCCCAALLGRTSCGALTEDEIITREVEWAKNAMKNLRQGFYDDNHGLPFDSSEDAADEDLIRFELPDPLPEDEESVRETRKTTGIRGAALDSVSR